MGFNNPLRLTDTENDHQTVTSGILCVLFSIDYTWYIPIYPIEIVEFEN